MILGSIQRAIETELASGWFGHRASAAKTRMLTALTSAALLDIDLAISIYLDAGKREKQETLNTLATSFQNTVGKIVDNVSSTAVQLEMAASTLTKTAETTQQLSGAVASASEEALSHVQSVAAATEEMTSSVSEIARQVQDSSDIAAEAVRQAEKTDGRIAQLSQ